MAFLIDEKQILVSSVVGMSSRIGELLYVGCSARIAARWQRSNGYDLRSRAEARYRRCSPARRWRAAPGAGARSWGGDESPIYGEADGRIGLRGHVDIAVPVSVHGETATGS